MANGHQSAVGSAQSGATGLDTEFHRGLGLYDSTMVVVGSMIGSGIFIVSSIIARLLDVRTEVSDAIPCHRWRQLTPSPPPARRLPPCNRAARRN